MKAGFFFLVISISIFGFPADVRSDGWYLGFYSGLESRTYLIDIVFFDIDPVDTRISTLALGKTLLSDPKTCALEFEVQASKYWGTHTYVCECPLCLDNDYDFFVHHSERQNHAEFNAVLVLRWLDFPWDRYVDTSFAIGEGISYATEKPPSERDYHVINYGYEDRASKILNYLLIEWSFKVSDSPWELFTRLHHRSGIYGLIKGIEGGSNFICAGVRYRFF